MSTTTPLLISLLLSISLLSPALSASSPATTISQFLNAHNVVRAKHRLPLLQWSQPLASYAKSYADQRRGDCKLVHSSADYGENIFWGQGGNWTPADAVTAWAAQEAWFNYNTNACMPGKDCLHYTQLVWRSTTSVGCATIKCVDGDTFIVCEYYPHGNVMGQKPY